MIVAHHYAGTRLLLRQSTRKLKTSVNSEIVQKEFRLGALTCDNAKRILSWHSLGRKENTMRGLKVPFNLISARTRILLFCVVITCFAALTALATPGAGFLFNIILSRGTIPTDVHQDIFIETDTVNGSTPNNNQGDNWSVKFQTSGPSDLA